MQLSTAITLNSLGLDWPDGTPALSSITGAFGAGRTGLIGINGSGKSTLLKLIAGELRPSTGSVSAVATVGYVPQTVIRQPGDTVAHLLGIAPALAALASIEAGTGTESDFEILDDRWEIESHAETVLAEIGFSGIGLDRPANHLSGGESTLIAIAGMRVQKTPITLLDEPTNNLDAAARAHVYRLIGSWQGTLLVVSHDTALLNLMDETAEIYRGELTVFGGPYAEWVEALGREQEAASRAARTAENLVNARGRQRVAAESTIATRKSMGKTARENRKASKLVMNQNKTNAQVSAGKMRSVLTREVERAKEASREAADRVRETEGLHAELPDPDVPSGKDIAVLIGTNREIEIRGPETIALIGANGVGKTRLLDGFIREVAAEPGRARAKLIAGPVGYLRQRPDPGENPRSALELMREVAPTATDSELRSGLARYLLRGDSALRPVGTLSGGERFRMELARLFLAEPPARLVILDEPTNNLDLPSVDWLVSALSAYRGALIVVSHDEGFLSRVRFTRKLELDAAGALFERDLGAFGTMLGE